MRKNLSLFIGVVLSAMIILPTHLSAREACTTKVKTTLSKKETQHQKKATERTAALLPQKNIKKTSDFTSIKPFKNLALPAPFRAPALTAAGDGTVIYGSVIYADNWTEENQPAGVYSFPATANTILAEVAINSGLSVNGGGVYIDGKYYFTEYISFFGMIFPTYHIFDTETWEEIGGSADIDITSIATDLTYDPVTLTTYGCFFNETGDGYIFGTRDPETGITAKISDLPMILYVVAANAKGDLYGIGDDGNLYGIDKMTGDLDLVGPTGVTPKYTQSGTFDPKTDKLYWAACLADETSALYEVNITTGNANLISAFPNNEEITGMYIPAPAAEDGAPAIAENLTATYTDGSTTGNIRFTMPTKTYAGETLNGSLSYSILFNNEEKANGTADPGNPVDREITVPAGMYTISVTTTNAVGNSPAAKIKMWIGNDAPKAVTAIHLEKGDTEGELTLTWNAPTEAIHDGYLDAASLTYKVVRYPEGTPVAENLTATTFSETLTPGQLSNFWYSVTAFAGNLEGETAFSNKVPLGSAFTVPYFEPFDNEADFELFTVIDANNDGKTWSYDSEKMTAKCTFNSSQPMNDWLITPPVTLGTDKLYKLYFKTKNASSSFPERLKVAFGTDRTVAAMTTELVPATVINTEEYLTMDVLIQAPAAGNYYIGFQCCSDADMFALYVDSIGIEEGPALTAPDSVTNIQVIPAERGALAATISFNAPVTTISGESLSDLTKIDLYREGEIIQTFNNPAPGASLSYTDNQAKQGYNTYSITAANTAGAGITAKIIAYVGIDIPASPTEITLKEVDGKAVITWKAPTTGANGAYIDPAALTYYIQRNDDEIVAQEISGLTFTDEPDLSGGQALIAYYVFAASDAGIGKGAASNGIVMGEPYTLPFTESFTAGKLDNSPWVISEVTGDAKWGLVEEGEYPTATAQDNDGGLASFIAGRTEGETARLYSAKITLKGRTQPALTFYYYVQPGATDKLIAEVSAEGGEFTPVKTIDLASGSFPEGWNKVTIPLNDYVNTNYIQIGFMGITGNGDYNLHIDNIRVKDMLDYNLATVGIEVPKKIKVGESRPVTVTIINEGLKEATGYTVELYRDGKMVNTQNGENLLPDSVRTYTFTETPTIEYPGTCKYYAIINYPADLDPANNKTAESIVTIIMPTWPKVTDLAGESKDGNAVLTWSEPDYSIESRPAEPVTDDMEDYEAFIISGIGEWTLVDVDGGEATYGINNGADGIIQYPNAAAAMAFQVFNPSAAGITVTDGQGNPTPWAPHSGDQMLAAFADEDGQNDDWLISPVLPGTEQVLSFFAKSVTDQYGLETIEILYSTTNTDIESFQKVNDPAVINEVPVDWTEITTTLPAGTKHFAIRCTSPDRFALLIDDITFTPASAVPEELVLQGYNVYRDGTKITGTPVTATTYTDNVPEAKEYKYTVTVVYDKGESSFSNELSLLIHPNSIDELQAAGIYVFGAERTIEIRNAEGMHIQVYTTDGKLLYEGMGEIVTKIPFMTGKYIVKIENKATKVLVK